MIYAALVNFDKGSVYIWYVIILPFVIHEHTYVHTLFCLQGKLYMKPTVHIVINVVFLITDTTISLLVFLGYQPEG